MEVDLNDVLEENSKIKAMCLTIIDFLKSNCVINIPRYQREYSWEKDNIDTMLKDIHKDYYLGNIISFKRNSCSEIIDGQQRIITTFLILISIRNITNDEKLKCDIDNIIYNENDECRLVLKDRIGSDGRNILDYILDDEKNVPDNSKKYNEIKNYLIVKKEMQLRDLNKVFNDLIKSLIVEICFVKEEIDAHEMFVNVNTKGKPLTEIEILKSHLFKYLLSKSNSDTYKEKWQEMLNNIPKRDYSSYVSDSFLFYVFLNDFKDNIKTSGTVKENFFQLLKNINNRQEALQVFNMMTGDDLDDIYIPYCAIKNHDLKILKENYYPNLTISLSTLNSLWEMFGEYGFAQSDILFVSLLKNKESFVNNHIDYLYTFMQYVFLYEIARSINGTSPAQYANSFKQLAKEVSNINDPSKIKQVLKKYILDRKINTEELKRNLTDSNRFVKNYKVAKYIIMLIDGNFHLGLTVEHFIHRKTKDENDKGYINYIGNFIPVIKDVYKDKTVVEKLELYREKSISEISIRKFLNTGIDETNYCTKILDRTNSIAEEFVKIINECFNKLTR